MGKLIASILAAAFAATLSLGAVIALVGVTIDVSVIASPVVRALATVAELLLGVFWLLGIVFVATHLAVIIFAQPQPPKPGVPAVQQAHPH